MLYFARWKVYTILAICLAGIVFSLPNLIERASVPAWFPHRQINLGLDLKGGAYLLLEVDMASVIRERVNNMVDGARTILRRDNINATSVDARDRGISVTLRDPGQAGAAVRALSELASAIEGGALSGGQQDLEIRSTPEGLVTATLTEPGLRAKATQAVVQSIEIIRRRIDETGVNEPIIARQGADRILVQLPGVQDPDRVKRLLGTTARMTFRLLDSSGEADPRRAPPGSEWLPAENERGPDGRPRQYLVRKRVEVEGASLTRASAGNNQQTGEWVVNFEFDSAGARRFGSVTQQNVGRPFAIVLDNKVLSAPVIREPITGGRGQISGSFTVQSASDLALLLRAGALPAPLSIIEERTVGPDLGADSIKAGLYACITGLVLVIAYMMLSYGLFGLFAVIAVLFNLILTFGALSLLEATLTLPGIAGILLTVGMSVDANILINERIREETRRGRTPIAAIEAGFSRAYSTIVDANLTTLIKMIILFALGSGPIKGFAVTISLGIITSMFTATVLVRLMVSAWLRRSRPKALAV